MLPNLSKMLHLTRGQKSVIVAYAAVMAIAAGIAIMIMSAADGVYAVPAEPTWFDIWVIIAGGLASCAALYASRRWMGGRGAMGVARAVLAAIVVSLATAILAGALIVPGYGMLAAPLLVLTAFLAMPVLAIAWFSALFAAHYLFHKVEQEKEHTNPAVSQLSALSQANLYGNRAR